MAIDTGVNNTEQVVVPTNGAVHIAPYGTTLPTTESTALNAAFTSVGWIGESAPKLRIGRELTDIKAWQRRGPILRRLKNWDIGVKIDLMELAYNTIDLALGGATISEVSTGHYKVIPAQIPSEMSLIVDMTDGTWNYRFVFIKGTVGGTTELDMPRDDAIKLPIDFSILELEASEDPFMILTDNPAFQEEWSEGDPA